MVRLRRSRNYKNAKQIFIKKQKQRRCNYAARRLWRQKVINLKENVSEIKFLLYSKINFKKGQNLLFDDWLINWIWTINKNACFWKQAFLFYPVPPYIPTQIKTGQHPKKIGQKFYPVGTICGKKVWELFTFIMLNKNTQFIKNDLHAF